MARADQKKRKAPEHDQDEKGAFVEAVRLEMLSDEEKRGDEDEEDEESDEQVDEFPEIDAGSDSEPDDDESDGDEEDEGGSPSGLESDSSDLHMFPKSKDVISGITGRPKRVYPEIEPEYDSDSSTEDVRVSFPMTVERYIDI